MASEKKKKHRSKWKVLRNATHFYKQETVFQPCKLWWKCRAKKKDEKFKRTTFSCIVGTARGAILKHARSQSLQIPPHRRVMLLGGASSVQHPPVFSIAVVSNGRSRDCKLYRPIWKRAILRNMSKLYLDLFGWFRTWCGERMVVDERLQVGRG